MLVTMIATGLIERLVIIFQVYVLPAMLTAQI